MSDAAPGWTPRQVRAAAGLLDVLWSLPAYERLVSAWGLSDAEATAAVSWLLTQLTSAIEADRPPLSSGH